MSNEWLLIIVVIALSGFFSGSELGFVSANRLKMEIKARKNSLNGKFINFFIRNPETFLSTTLVGNNIVNILYSTLMALFLREPVIGLYELSFGAIPSELTILSIQTIIAASLIMVFGEVIPKVLFRIHSESLISFFALPLRLCSIIFRPIVAICNYVAESFLKTFLPETGTSEQVFRRQDIEMLLKEIGDNDDSEIDKDDSEILTNVLELSTKRVKESMIPRTEITAVEKNTTVQEVLKVFISSGYSKIPVFEESIDNVIGVVFAYDLFKKPKTLSEILRPVKIVPASQKSKDLLSDFQKLKISLAIVIDEYGGTAGLVTSEDLLEEVVGDIQDEYDFEDAVIKKIAPKTYVLSGDVEIKELNEKYSEIGLPESQQYDTIAGFIMNETGRIPTVNEEIIFDRHKFIISKVTYARINTVKLVVLD